MSDSALKGFSTRQTPQSEPIPGSTQIENSAGGHAWQVDDWQRMRRFLILGTEGGTYYASERKLTVEAADVVRRCVSEDGSRAVTMIVEVSVNGRAPRNDQALFALALAAKLGDDKTRKVALEALPEVARIGTHLFMFCGFIEQFGGWSRGSRRAVGQWYTDKEPQALAYQLVKYRQREGWSHRDVLRVAHPPAKHHDEALELALAYAAGKFPEGALLPEELAIVRGFHLAQESTSARNTAALIREFGLPREAVKPEHLTELVVWEALLENMPMTAMIRNLATMTRIGLLAPLSVHANYVARQLGDPEKIRKARVHPIAILAALATYAQGHGFRSEQTWEPVSEIVNALDGAFYLAFGNVVPARKRFVLGLDISGSMDHGEISGVPGLTPRVAACAMALVTAATEPRCATMAFTREPVPFEISPRERLDDVVARARKLPMGGTDCALPIAWAYQHSIEADAFVIYTDSETWAGDIHPAQAIRHYRDDSVRDARLVVCALEANEFSIADPEDAGMLDVVGFDTSTPAIISEFVSERL